MKHLVLGIALIAATSLSAQKFEIGFDGGLGFNTVPSPVSTELGRLHASDASLAASVKALYQGRKWQYGLSVAYAELSYKWTHYSPFYLPPYPGVNPPIVQTSTYIAKPAIPFKLFANRKMVFRHLETYAGISAGYVLVTNAQYAYDNEMGNKQNGNGWTAGLQIGGTYSISKRFGINAEAEANYMSLNVFSIQYALWQFPFTLGIRYKL